VHSREAFPIAIRTAFCASWCFVGVTNPDGAEV
jgi:hypothetical protein